MIGSAAKTYEEEEFTQWKGETYVNRSGINGNVSPDEDFENWAKVSAGGITALRAVKVGIFSHWDGANFVDHGDSMVVGLNFINPPIVNEDGTTIRIKDPGGNYLNSNIFASFNGFKSTQVILNDNIKDENGIARATMALKIVVDPTQDQQITLNPGTQFGEVALYSNYKYISSRRPVAGGGYITFGKTFEAEEIYTLDSGPLGFQLHGKDLTNWPNPAGTAYINYLTDNQGVEYKSLVAGQLNIDLSNGQDIFGPNFPPYVEVLEEGGSVATGQRYFTKDTYIHTPTGLEIDITDHVEPDYDGVTLIIISITTTIIQIFGQQQQMVSSMDLKTSKHYLAQQLLLTLYRSLLVPPIRLEHRFTLERRHKNEHYYSSRYSEIQWKHQQLV